MNAQTHEITVVCFAGLRKFFPGELKTTIEGPCPYREVLQHLGRRHPEAKPILENCRIAIDEVFIDSDEPLDPTKTVFLIPPSSGG